MMSYFYGTPAPWYKRLGGWLEQNFTFSVGPHVDLWGHPMVSLSDQPEPDLSRFYERGFQRATSGKPCTFFQKRVVEGPETEDRCEIDYLKVGLAGAAVLALAVGMKS